MLICGSRYDVYAAAADAADVWLGMVKLEFDFSADGADCRQIRSWPGWCHCVTRCGRVAGPGAW